MLKASAPSGGPTATMTCTIQTFSACERLTPGLAPRAQARVTIRKGARSNNVNDGGETDFPRLDIAIAPRTGTLLAWNNADPEGVPNPYVVHAGNPVGSGLKYVVTRWYRVKPTLQLG